ncbi:MAG: fatty acid desaturase [Pseudomonadota bacterium]
MQEPNLRQATRVYAQADDTRAWIELAASLIVYVASIAISLTNYQTLWILIPSLLVTTGMGLRIYMIHHDLLHQSFFNGRKTNVIVGTLISPIAMTPYKATRRVHNLHHTYVNDLDHRHESFEIPVMTLREWQAAGFWQRIYYRIYRSPLILVFIGPFLLYAIIRRFPIRMSSFGIGDLMICNVLIAAYGFGMYWMAGWTGVLIWLIPIYLACAFGGFIPYVLHNFEDVEMGVKPDFDFETAALNGSSVLDWGWLFHIVTMNIAYHDLHHLNAKIPGYALPKAHADLEAKGLISPKRVTFMEGVRSLRWKLYDEENGRMIPFPAAISEPVWGGSTQNIYSQNNQQI